MKSRKTKHHLTILILLLSSLALIPAACFAASSPDRTSPNEAPQLEDLVVAHNSKGRQVPLEKLDKGSYNGFIYVLKNGTAKKARAAMENRIDSINDESVANEIFNNKIYRAESLDVIEEVADPETISYIEPDYAIHILDDRLSEETVEVMSTNDTYYSRNKWIYTMLGVEELWDQGIRGSGNNGNSTPTVAVIDSGMAGARYSSRRHEDIDYSKVPRFLYNNAYSSAEDENGHGTFVAGEIFATMNNGKGVAGLMPEVRVVPVRCMDASGSGYISYSIDALNYIVSNDTAEVVNMSLGSDYYASSFQTACTRAADAGIILVASAGNDGVTTYNYPASYNGVISVGAVDKSGSIAYFSNYNSKVDVAAPGVDITGLDFSGSSAYCSMSGTSMSSPIIAAMAAMAKSVDSSIDHDDFMTILQKTSVDKGASGYDNRYGYGIADFAAAYDYIAGGSSPASPTEPDNPTTDPVPAPAGNMEMTVSGSSFTYTGSELTPPVKVTTTVADAGSGNSSVLELDEGTDYSLSYRNNINAGTATAVATGKGNYLGQVATADFTISARYISSVSIPDTEYTYTGEAIEPVVTVEDSGKTLTEGTDYTVSYSDNINAGLASVIVTGTGNYQGTVTRYFRITARDLYYMSLDLDTYVYTGDAIEPYVRIWDSDWNILEEGTDYTLSYSDNINAGTARVTARGMGGYAGSLSETFTIEKAESDLSFYAYRAVCKSKALKKKALRFVAIDVLSHNGTVTFKAKGLDRKSRKALKFYSDSGYWYWSDYDEDTEYIHGGITIKKGTKKGTYKMKVTITDSGDENHEGGSIVKTIKVKVK